MRIKMQFIPKSALIVFFFFLSFLTVAGEVKVESYHIYSIGARYHKINKRFEFFSENGITPQYPALLGRYSLNTPGCVVWSIVTIPYYTIKANPQVSEMMRQTYYISDVTFGLIGYYLVGTPFYIVEKVFWDGPCYLYSSIFGNDKKPENKNEVMTSKNNSDCHKKAN